ncbi:hypothetical protein AALP_AAs59356U000100, partial [Arabis alpina]
MGRVGRGKEQSAMGRVNEEGIGLVTSHVEEVTQPALGHSGGLWLLWRDGIGDVQLHMWVDGVAYR